MLHDQGLPLHLYDEACDTTVYLHNRSPHQIPGMITLEEAFSGRKLDVSHFNIFGASISYHVSKDLRKKLEQTTKLGVFAGYTKSIPNYQVYLTSPIMKFV